MKTPVDALLEQVAAVDPEKARYLRWVRPQLGDAGVLEKGRAFLAERQPAPRSGWGARETLVDLDLSMDPDSPTGMFAAFTDEEGTLQEEEPGPARHR